MADYLTPEKLENASKDCDSWDLFFHGSELEDVVTRLGKIFPTLSKILRLFFDTGLFRPFQTEAELLAYVPVTNPSSAYAFDTKKLYLWNGTSWIDEGLSPLDLAKKYSDNLVNIIIQAFDIKKADDPDIISLLNEALGRSLLYYDKKKERIVGAGLLESVFEVIEQLKAYEDTRYIPGKLDKDGRILWGWDKLTDRFFCGEAFGGQQIRKYKYFPQKPVAAEINHMLSYGESLSVGATATNILSTTQPYLNTTFGFTVGGTIYASPRMDVAATSIQPLREIFYSPASDGGGNRGETHCSGAANYASLEFIRGGVSPQDHIIFASTAGYGGAKISDLAKGGAIYPRVLNHINKARELYAGKSHKAIFTPFIIGTNDAFYATSYLNFKNTFQQVHFDFNADVKALTGQEEDVLFAIVQISYGVRTQPQISKALWDLPQENENFLFVTPTYHLQHSEGTHLTNIGYKRLGAYYGRAYAQYFLEGRFPDYIKPLSAMVEGNKVTLKFDVPTLPLQIDRTSLAITTDDGFKVYLLDDDGLIAKDSNGLDIVLPISTITATNDTVILELGSLATNQILVRYAMDYLGTGLNILNGASGNLRDSTPDSVVIGNTPQPLYHVCPHFELIAHQAKGI